MIKKEGKKSCSVCKNSVDLEKDHYVILSTMNRAKSPDTHTYFHFSCWIKYFNEKVTEKAKNQVNSMQQQVLKILETPMIKQVLAQIQGSDIALNMLQTPINVATVISKDRVERKIKDGRKRTKRSEKKRKAK